MWKFSEFVSKSKDAPKAEVAYHAISLSGSSLAPPVAPLDPCVQGADLQALVKDSFYGKELALINSCRACRATLVGDQFRHRGVFPAWAGYQDQRTLDRVVFE